MQSLPIKLLKHVVSIAIYRIVGYERPQGKFPRVSFFAYLGNTATCSCQAITLQHTTDVASRPFNPFLVSRTCIDPNQKPNLIYRLHPCIPSPKFNSARHGINSVMPSQASDTGDPPATKRRRNWQAGVFFQNMALQRCGDEEEKWW